LGVLRIHACSAYGFRGISGPPGMVGCGCQTGGFMTPRIGWIGDLIGWTGWTGRTGELDQESEKQSPPRQQGGSSKHAK